jgi:hypothetical protein
MIRTLPLILVVAGSAALFAAPPAVERALPSVALLLLEDAKGQPKALGSGFFIKSNIIATSLDLVAEAKDGYAKVSGQNTKYDIKGVVATDVVNNLALIEVEGANVQPLKLGDDSKVEVGDRIYALGNPKGLKAVVADGIVSGIHKKGQDRFFQITATINPGSNGGPVLDEQGNVIGVGQSFFSKGKPFSIVVPSGYVSELVKNLEAPAFNQNIQPKKLTLVEGQLSRSVKCENIVWKGFAYDDFTFSVRNTLRNDIKDVVGMLIMEDDKGASIEHFFFRIKEIPAGLAIRTKQKATEGVRAIVQNARTLEDFRQKANYSYRILNFTIVEGGKGRFDPSNPLGN